MRVLVTGGSGLIGSYLIPRLLDRGDEVYAIVRPGSYLPETSGLHHVPMDLLAANWNEKRLQEIRPDTLIHLAWCTTPGDYWTSRENVAWLNTTISLVDQFTEAGGKRVVVAGTCAEYEWSSGHFVEKGSRLAPTTSYGAAKLATYQLLQPICNEAGLDLLWGRIFFPYGRGENPLRLLPSVLSAMLAGEPVKCTHGQQLRDFVHADDVAAALVHLGTDAVAAGVYNLSSGAGVRIRDIVEMCRQVTGSQSEVIYGARSVPEGDPEEIVGVNQKLLRTGWRSAWTMQRGLLDYVKYLESRPNT